MRWIIGEKINAYAILWGKPEGRYVDVTIVMEMCFKEIRYEDANWVLPNPDGIVVDFMETAMTLQVP
jgi:hypothetical protein